MVSYLCTASAQELGWQIGEGLLVHPLLHCKGFNFYHFEYSREINIVEYPELKAIDAETFPPTPDTYMLMLLCAQLRVHLSARAS